MPLNIHEVVIGWRPQFLGAAGGIRVVREPTGGAICARTAQEVVAYSAGLGGSGVDSRRPAPPASGVGGGSPSAAPGHGIKYEDWIDFTNVIGKIVMFFREVVDEVGRFLNCPATRRDLDGDVEGNQILAATQTGREIILSVSMAGA